MPTTFKNLKQIQIATKTPEEDLVLCTECGGLQAMAMSSIRLDCDNCDGTGYENLYTTSFASAAFRPGAIAQWNYAQGGVTYVGECSIKLDYRYRELLDSASYIVMDGISWKFSFLRQPGEALANKRVVLALSRK